MQVGAGVESFQPKGNGINIKVLVVPLYDAVTACVSYTFLFVTQICQLHMISPFPSFTAMTALPCCIFAFVISNDMYVLLSHKAILLLIRFCASCHTSSAEPTVQFPLL